VAFTSRLHRVTAGHPPELATAIAASRMVFRVAHLLEARIDEALRPFDISMREYLALFLIADDAVEPLRPSDLSATLDATRTQVTRLLDGLEKKGLARRRPSAEDRRSLQLTLTRPGQSLLKRAARMVHPAYEACWKDVGADGARQALDSLRKVHAALQPGDGA